MYRQKCKVCSGTGEVNLPPAEQNVKRNKKTKEEKTVISPQGHVSFTTKDNYGIRVRRVVNGPKRIVCPYCKPLLGEKKETKCPYRVIKDVEFKNKAKRKADKRKEKRNEA